QVPTQNYVMLKQSSPTGASEYEFFKSDTGSGLDIRQELDPLGAGIRLNPGPVGHARGAGDLPSSGGGPADSRFGDLSNLAAGCVTLLDGVPTFCDFVTRMGNGGGLQLRVGTTKYDIQLLGGSSTIWVDAWEDVYTPGKGTISYDEKNHLITTDAGTLTTRNVGYFVTTQLSAGTWSPSLASGSGMQQRTGGGSGAQNTRARDVDYARSVYQGDLGKKLTKCINEVFSKNVDYEHAQRGPKGRKVGKGSDLLDYQQMRNAPNIQFEDMGPTTMGRTRPLDYQSGIIRISNQNIHSFEDGQRTYVHELGNYLSTKIVYWDPANSLYGSLDYFGDPNGIKLSPNVKLDYDSGAALEECMFGVKE